MKSPKTVVALLSVFLSVACGTGGGGTDDDDETMDESGDSLVLTADVGLFQCCPHFTAAEEMENEANGDVYSCKWFGCTSAVLVESPDLGTGLTALSCDFPDTYELVRCDSCRCGDGNTVIGTWQQGTPEPTFRGVCSGGAFGVSSGELSCGNPNCANKCINAGYPPPS